MDLPKASLDLVLAALERIGARLPEDPTRSLFAKGADALVEMAREVLSGEAGDGGRSPSAEGHQVVVHVDAAALGGDGGQADLPLPTVRRLCCDGAVVPLVERDGQDGTCYFVRPDGRPVEPPSAESGWTGQACAEYHAPG